MLHMATAPTMVQATDKQLPIPGRSLLPPLQHPPQLLPFEGTCHASYSTRDQVCQMVDHGCICMAHKSHQTLSCIILQESLHLALLVKRSQSTMQAPRLGSAAQSAEVHKHQALAPTMHSQVLWSGCP